MPLSGIKTIFRYLKGTIDLDLLYPYREKAKYEKLAAFTTANDDDRPVEVQPTNGRHSDRKVLTPYTENPCDVLVTRTKAVPKLVMSLPWVTRQYLGGPPSKL